MAQSFLDDKVQTLTPAAQRIAAVTSSTRYTTSRAFALGLLGWICVSSASAGELRVWSAGAMEPGLLLLVDDFTRETGHTVQLTVAVPAVLRQRVEAGESPDALIAPTPVIDALVQSGKVNAEGRVLVGKVGVGVAVRSGAALPDVSTPERFTQSLLAAQALVYNRASTGIYFERLLDRLGIAEPVKAKTVRYPDGVAVMEHLLRGSSGEVGIGAITEIKAYEPKGLRFVGPLPADLQNYTSYFAGVLTTPSSDAAKALIRFVTSPRAKAVFSATGVE